jgi:hypothetical protein
VILNPLLTSATDLIYMFRTDAKLKPFILQEEYGTKVSVVGAGSEEEFKNRRHLFGTERLGNAGYGLWQYALKRSRRRGITSRQNQPGPPQVQTRGVGRLLVDAAPVTPLYCSFFTPAYAEHAAGLVASLDAFGLPHDVRAVEGGGSWVANVNRKAGFLLERMRRHPGRPLVWLDADARVRQRPDLFDSLTCDFAAHWRHGVELLSGTMYWGPTTIARLMCESWQRRCARYPDRWDQVTLDEVVKEWEGDLKVHPLPASYTRVFDDAKMGDPVIEHLQASRQLAKVAG